MVEGEILVREGKLDAGFAALREAISAEDALRYDEPPGWILPVRHALGASLMANGRYAEAEQVYRDDLKRLPDNGWSLFGLAKALEMQRKSCGGGSGARKVQADLGQGRRHDQELVLLPAGSLIAEPRTNKKRDHCPDDPFKRQATNPTMNKTPFLLPILACFWIVQTAIRAEPTALSAYFDNTGRTDVLSGGVKMIDVQTPKGKFKVWTKRIGNNPKIKVLLLHGGPGSTHEYLEACDSFLPAAGIEYYYYDQLGSAYSDQPDEPSLWEVPRFVEEVEQVRQALGLHRENFYLVGHSFGGILAIEYALKYQGNLKGLVIANMMSSIPASTNTWRRHSCPR